MGFYVAKQTVKKIISSGKDVSKSKVLVLGATFKENVEDIRNSKVADVVKELVSYGVTVEVSDPRANSDELKHEYGFELVKSLGKNYDAIIVAVNHDEFKNLNEEWFASALSKDGLVVDIKGMLKGKIKNLNYWSL